MGQKQRVRVFDNGTSTATFVGSNTDKNILVVTFDPFGHVNPDEPGFGEHVLTTHGYDVLAFQKRTESYYQDISRMDVHRVLENYIINYKKFVFYGSSVGGYAALYFGSRYNADILAISPRVSSHPVYQEHYGQSGARARLHQHGPIHEGDPVQARHVVLLYDPVLVSQRAAVPDIIYMNEHILPAFPCIDVRPLRHTGHPSTTSLAETHQLRPVLFRFLETGTVDLDKYRRLRSASPTYLVNFSAWLQQKRRLKWAISLAERALHQAPNSPQVHFQRARLFLAKGDFVSARQAAVRGLSAEVPERSRHLQLIAVFEEAHDSDGVLEIVKHAFGSTPEARPPSMLRSMATKASTVLEKSGHLEEALYWGLKASQLGDPKIHLLQRAAHLAYKLSHCDQSLELLDQTLRIQSDLAYSRWLQALTLKKLGRTLEAQSSLEQAIVLKPSEKYWMLQLVDLYILNGNQLKARHLIQEVSSFGPLSTNLLVHKAELLGKLDERASAIAALQDAVKTAPLDANIQKRLIEAFRQADRLVEAADQAQQALAGNPGHPHLRRLHNEISTALEKSRMITGKIGHS